MRVLNFLFALTGVAVIYGCTEYSDYFQSVNKAPLISVNSMPELYDTLKIGHKNQYSLSVVDEENINISFIQTGTDSINISNNILTVFAKGENDNEITLSAMDSFDKESTAMVHLHTFINLPPVAVLEISENTYGGVKIDASGSYDKDYKYGGMIVRYYYNINGYLIEDNLSSINYIFESTGAKLIKLKVKDNEGRFSNEISMNYIVN
jgi:hypothetical protein